MAALPNGDQSSGFDDLLIGTLVYRASASLSLAGSGKSHGEIEACLNHPFQNFDWNGMLDSLGVVEGHPIRPIGDGTSVQEHVVALIGQTYRVSPEIQKVALLRSLANALSPVGLEQASRCSGGASIMGSAVSISPTQFDSGRKRHAENAVELSQYTSMLNQMAQKENKKFKRTKEETLSLDPPSFKVTTQYGDISCSNDARTKKMASHLAARDIYSHLVANA